MNTKLNELIKNKYKNVDNMLNYTDGISRAYTYQMVQGTKRNPSKDILLELCKLFDLSLEEVIKLFDEDEEV